MTRRRTDPLVGVISDTHGLMRPQALAALAGCDAILHAGDIGAPEILAALQGIAPVTAVRGNNDRAAWARVLDDTAIVRLGGTRLYLLHDLNALDLDPQRQGFAAVIAGHSHRPVITERDGVLYVNPGSAGPRRFKLPIAVARLRVGQRRVHGELIMLDG